MLPAPWCRGQACALLRGESVAPSSSKIDGGLKPGYPAGVGTRVEVSRRPFCARNNTVKNMSRRTGLRQEPQFDDSLEFPFVEGCGRSEGFGVTNLGLKVAIPVPPFPFFVKNGLELTLVMLNFKHTACHNTAHDITSSPESPLLQTAYPAPPFLFLPAS
ncbi:hypothetical protein BDP55DRAFT_627575 [Colletotrichum godetiae]|uniref:Uncharacterized protein n=1 Tax=Colletotrichum godetiae TaxID=1209918 RepID=A0AAJ0AZA4_9PEZI|nr:uncharacterized protein BDP55DRAFT_627575 [Colletotrichum godetiae]KAK1690889.1 hypothetical protein BDP55DRAFT_627575 [Colletotrichum godetiae]